MKPHRDYSTDKSEIIQEIEAERKNAAEVFRLILALKKYGFKIS